MVRFFTKEISSGTDSIRFRSRKKDFSLGLLLPRVSMPSRLVRRLLERYRSVSCGRSRGRRSIEQLRAMRLVRDWWPLIALSEWRCGLLFTFSWVKCFSFRIVDGSDVRLLFENDRVFKEDRLPMKSGITVSPALSITSVWSDWSSRIAMGIPEKCQPVVYISVMW